MSSEPRRISKKALLLLHEESLSDFGGARGLRDEGLLESAHSPLRDKHVYNPYAAPAELAAYCYGIAKNHAFVDGNNRAALLCAGLFLAINGLRLNASEVDAIETIFDVAAGTISEAELALWIAHHSEER